MKFKDRDVCSFQAFDEAFTAMTGCKLVMKPDSLQRLMVPVNQLSS